MEFVSLHFGSAQGITDCFTSMRSSYPWGKHRPLVADSRIPAKANNEYHGLERHAYQYHATAQCEYSYHHWIIAAYWRVQDMQINKFSDPGHSRAIQYALRQAMFNKKLWEWQISPSKERLPKPEDFGLDMTLVAQKEKEALNQIESYRLPKGIQSKIS